MSVCYPEPVELDAYGNGGFRFADMSHQGSLLILPSGIYAWDCANFDEAEVSSFDLVFEKQPVPEFILFGTGDKQRFPNRALKQAFIAQKIGLEVMDTGAAARTYNVLQAEGRNVGAALIAVT